MECARALAGDGPGQRLATIMLLLLAAFAAACPERARAAPARLKPAQAPSFARACTIAPFEGTPLFASPPAAAAPSAAKEESDDADDNSDDDSDDDDADDDSVHGYIVPGTGTCLSISGSVNAGMQYDAYRVSRSAPPPPPNATSTQVSASFTITTSHDLASGLRIGSIFSLSMRNPPDSDQGMTIDEATVSIGPWTFGMADSRFSFWGGDDFNTSAQVPSRTVGLIGLDLPLTESWTASLSLEDPALGSTSSIPVQEGRRVPDGVARLVYASGPWTVHTALALRDIPGSPDRLGRAGIIGATYEADILGKPSNISGQIVGGIDSAPYLGSNLDTRVVRQVLFGGDPTRGFSAVLSTHREWTDEIATNAYVSRYWLSVPLAGQAEGKIRIDRATANLVWTPVDGFKAGVETSVAWAQFSLGGRVIPAGLAGRQITTQVFIERTF
ncbi:hypothetical protein DWF00_11425 [Bosea caraganae]|uniref:Porin n=1 Tax=Bosea caraganae TaxID=2763117 RepID=A0A370LC73_9HYPH|nr:hypothetical protein [Bosea caraganae]RDJ27547.1 hypothetical protein DWF00_11425 [Bosea caraganae]RDJ29562.1 hypothetical protein DWE98_03195 [Bosea caraganae]